MCRDQPSGESTKRSIEQCKSLNLKTVVGSTMLELATGVTVRPLFIVTGSIVGSRHESKATQHSYMALGTIP
jgi:hypothetical protein